MYLYDVVLVAVAVVVALPVAAKDSSNSKSSVYSDFTCKCRVGRRRKTVEGRL